MFEIRYYLLYTCSAEGDNLSKRSVWLDLVLSLRNDVGLGVFVRLIKCSILSPALHYKIKYRSKFLERKCLWIFIFYLYSIHIQDFLENFRSNFHRNAKKTTKTTFLFSITLYFMLLSKYCSIFGDGPIFRRIQFCELPLFSPKVHWKFVDPFFSVISNF